MVSASLQCIGGEVYTEQSMDCLGLCLLELCSLSENSVGCNFPISLPFSRNNLLCIPSTMNIKKGEGNKVFIWTI